MVNIRLFILNYSISKLRCKYTKKNSKKQVFLNIFK